MLLSQLQEELRNLVINNTKRAIDRLVEVLDRSSDYYNEAYQLQFRLKQLLDGERKGIISREEFQVETVRLTKNFLDLIDLLEVQDIRPNIIRDSDSPILDPLLDPPTVKKLIKELDPEVQISTTLYYVNCNRERSIDTAFNYFEQFYNNQRPYQFYFFSACSTQRARSFSERLVYEIDGYLEDMEGGEQAFRYWPTPRDERVEPFELPVGRNLRSSKVKFKKLLGEKLEFTGNQTIETYLNTGKPEMDYKAIAMSFVYQEEDWKPFIPEYFQWIITTFDQANVREDCPTFLFFFSIDVRDIHSVPVEQLEEQKKQIYEDLEGLVAANITSTIHLSRLMPVPKQDVKAWLTKLGTDNDAMQERLIQLMVSQDTLSDKDRKQYIRDQLINMDDIELFQKWLLQYADEKGRGF